MGEIYQNFFEKKCISETLSNFLLNINFKFEDNLLHDVANIFDILYMKGNFRSHRWGSLLLGLRALDPPLDPPSIWAGEKISANMSAKSPSNISANPYKLRS